jgi:L-lactate dehydrogenase complex protein LldG
MSSRDLILSRLRAAGRTPAPLPAVPLFDQDLPPALDAFKQALARVGGIWCEPPADGDLDALIRARFPTRGWSVRRCPRWPARGASKPSSGRTS